MITIGIGFSREKNAALAAEEVVLRATKSRQLSGKAGLALVFCSSDFPYPPLLKSLDTQLEGTPIIGLSGPAIFSRDGIFSHGVLLLLLDFPSDIFCTAAAINNLKNTPVHQAGEELGEKMLQGFRHMQRCLSLTFFDRVIEEGYNFVTGIQEHLGTSFPCIGACAADQFSPTANRLLTNHAAVADGCGSVLLGGKINFGFGIQHGWKPLGKPRVITSAAGNLIKSINDQPAVKLYEEYLATTLTELKKELAKLSVFYPIGIKIEGENEYLIRNVIRIDDDGSLHCQGNVPEGASIRLMISTRETCLNATERAIDAALTTLANPAVKFVKEKTSQFAIAFSSFSRYTLLKRDAIKEHELMKQALGSIPYIGIYTASELAPFRTTGYHGQEYFHNQTFSCLIFEG